MNRSAIYTLIYFTCFMCVNNLGRNGSIFSRINNSIGNLITGKKVLQSDKEVPHISLKIKPATSLHLSRNELNMLILDIKHEVSKQMEELRDEIIDKGREDERHMSAWTLNHAPVYIPYAKTVLPHSGENSKFQRINHNIKDFKPKNININEKNKEIQHETQA